MYYTCTLFIRCDNTPTSFKYTSVARENIELKISELFAICLMNYRYVLYFFLVVVFLHIDFRIPRLDFNLQLDVHFLLV